MSVDGRFYFLHIVPIGSTCLGVLYVDRVVSSAAASRFKFSRNCSTWSTPEKNKKD